MRPVRRPEMGAASPRQKAEDDARFKADLLDLIPFLRAFARSLCGNQETADDIAGGRNDGDGAENFGQGGVVLVKFSGKNNRSDHGDAVGHRREQAHAHAEQRATAAT